MSNTFIERLRQNKLTDSDQCNNIKKSPPKPEISVRTAINDDWKSWELVPVSSAPYTASSEKPVYSEETVRLVHRAMAKLEP